MNKKLYKLMNWAEIEGIVKAAPATSLKRKKNPCERKTSTAITLIWGIVSVVVVVYFRLHIVDWVKELFAPEEKQEYVGGEVTIPSAIDENNIIPLVTAFEVKEVEEKIAAEGINNKDDNNL